MAEPAGKQIGDYEILRELGHGGMGQVYLVRNVLSDRVEAMKVLLPDLAQESDLASRFMREIKLLASLEHPNIASLRTAFTAENQLVMIMEYVEGDTLAHRLSGGAFSTTGALNYTDQVLAALSYAHSRHVIHRDIKPANMMLTPARRGQAHGLRHRPFQHRSWHDRNRRHSGLARLHVARAGEGGTNGRAVGLIFVGRIALPDGDREADVLCHQQLFPHGSACNGNSAARRLRCSPACPRR